MSTAREKMAAKAAKVAQRSQGDAAPTPAPEAPEPASTSPEPHSPPQGASAPPRARGQGSGAKVTEQSGMVRTTVDLAPAMHRELRALLADVAADLGRTRVTASDAHRVLVRRLLNDPAMREQFIADCREQL